jgi:hypothetical protein
MTFIFSKTSLTGEPGSTATVGAFPGYKLLPLLGGKQMVDPLDQ